MGLGIDEKYMTNERDEDNSVPWGPIFVIAVLSLVSIILYHFNY